MRILLSPVSLEKVVVGESLKACGLTDRKASALRWVVVDVVVPVFGDMGDNRRRWVPTHLDLEAVGEGDRI